MPLVKPSLSSTQMGFDPNRRHTESGRQGVTYHSCWEKSCTTKPWKTSEKFPLGLPLPTHTEKGQARARDDTKQHRRQGQILHHVKGNIFKKTLSYRRAAPSSTEEFTQGSLSKQFVIHRTVRMNTPFTRLLLERLHRNINGIFFLYQLNWNINTLKWHISELAE